MSVLTGFTTNVNGTQVDLSYIFQNGNYVIDFYNGVLSGSAGYVTQYGSSNYNLPNFYNNNVPLLFDTTQTTGDTFTNCLLTTNFKQNAIDLSYIQVTPNQGTNFGSIGWLRSKYYIYQYPNLNVYSSTYLITQQSTQTLNLHSSVVGFKFIAIGGGGAGQNAGGSNSAPIYGFGGSGGGCVVGYYNFSNGDNKILTIQCGVGGVAGYSGQYVNPYFGNTSAGQGSQPGQNGYDSSITFQSNSITKTIIAGGGPGGSYPYQSGSTSTASNGITYGKWESAAPTYSQVGSDSGFTQIDSSPPYSILRQLIQPNVYQVNNTNQIIFQDHTGSSEQLNLSYMYGNNYVVPSSTAYSNTITNVGSGGYGGCRHDQLYSTIGYYGNNNSGGPSGAGPGSAGAPGLVLIVPQFTTITSF